jgi:hypothetical protein
MKVYKALYLSTLLIVTCSNDHDPKVDSKDVTVTYPETADDFSNPERGFYHYSETYASSFSGLSEAVLKGYRTPKKASGASYDVVSSLLFRYYVLDIFKNTALSESFLNNIRSDFTIARASGVKLIPRFTYTIDVTSGDCPESFICPPYGDAPKNIVLGHIGQLKPLFEENADVIAFVQMGFIGTWGENYYTDYFGDASSNDQSKLLDENWADRIEVLHALLDATPDEIMVQVRYPQLKQRFVYGITAPVSSAALTEEEGFSDTDEARIGFHNDCFLASSDDYGTYEDYGNSSSPRQTANSVLRNYFAADSKYVVVGGETCSDDYSPQNDCAPAGNADTDMRNLHYTYLNTDYNNQVNNDWVSGGCMESIRKNLGYRFVLKEGTFPSLVSTKDPLAIKLSLENVGYASPVKARPVALILRNKTDGTIHSFVIDTDIRRWYSGEITLDQQFDISAVEPGTYDLLLNLPDAHSTISTRPEYAIRLANNGVWEEQTGYNLLNHELVVK